MKISFEHSSMWVYGKGCTNAQISCETFIKFFFFFFFFVSQPLLKAAFMMFS